MPQCSWHGAVAPGPFPKGGRIDLEFDEMPDGLQRVTKKEPRTLQRAEEVADHGKGATFHPFKENRRSACLIDTPVNLGCFQIRIDLLLNAHQMAGALEVGNASTEIGITHG